MQQILGWLRENAEWLFQGIGVVILVGLGQLAFRATRRSIPSSSGSPNADPSELAGGAFAAARIMREFEAAPPLQRTEIAKHFVGLPLNVNGAFCNSWQDRDEVTLQLSGLPSVFLIVNPVEWPGLTLLCKGARISAQGRVESVTEYGVTVRPDTLRY